MRTREPVPDWNHGGDHPQQELPGQHPDPKQDLGSGPSLTIAEAARLCGVSASTIRRHLAAGRFPSAHQQPSPIPGQRGLWHIPTRDLLAAGLRPRQARTPDQEQQHEPSRHRGTGQPGADRVESSSTPWSLNVPVAEPPRTWPPSGPTRSRPWRPPCGRCKRIAPPQRPIRTALLSHRRHHPTPHTQPGQPPSPACCRWCRSDGRPSANSARRRRRRSSDGRSAGNGHQSGAGPNVSWFDTCQALRKGCTGIGGLSRRNALASQRVPQA
jgi:hypothetical protein